MVQGREMFLLFGAQIEVLDQLPDGRVGVAVEAEEATMSRAVGSGAVGSGAVGSGGEVADGEESEGAKGNEKGFEFHDRLQWKSLGERPSFGRDVETVWSVDISP